MMLEADDSGVSLSKLDQSALSDTNPLIFQCSQCNTIVGDSLSWVSADKVMRTIALAYVSSKVGVKGEICIATNGRDQGSTYHCLYCLQCNETLGKKYIASSPEIDGLRGHYNLNAEKLNSYKLGSSEQGCSDELGNMFTVPTPKSMWRQISKIKYLLISMNDRISALESQHTGTEKGTGTSGRSEEGEPEERGTDDRDTESSMSSVTVSSRFSNCSGAVSEMQMTQLAPGSIANRKKLETKYEHHPDSELNANVAIPAKQLRKNGNNLMQAPRTDKLTSRGNSNRVEVSDGSNRTETWNDSDRADAGNQGNRIGTWEESHMDDGRKKSDRSETRKQGMKKRVPLSAKDNAQVERSRKVSGDTNYSDESMQDTCRHNEYRDNGCPWSPPAPRQSSVENSSFEARKNALGSRSFGLRSGSRQSRQNFMADSFSEMSEFDGEPNSKSNRMESWPHSSSAKKRKRISTPQDD